MLYFVLWKNQTASFPYFTPLNTMLYFVLMRNQTQSLSHTLPPLTTESSQESHWSMEWILMTKFNLP